MNKRYNISAEGLDYLNKPSRNRNGHINVDYFKEAIIIYCIVYGYYIPNMFKAFIESLNILNNRDVEKMRTLQYPVWKHHVDAAKQQLLEKKILIDNTNDSFSLSLDSTDKIFEAYPHFFQKIH